MKYINVDGSKNGIDILYIIISRSKTKILTADYEQQIEQTTHNGNIKEAYIHNQFYMSMRHTHTQTHPQMHTLFHHTYTQYTSSTTSSFILHIIKRTHMNQ